MAIGIFDYFIRNNKKKENKKNTLLQDHTKMTSKKIISVLLHFRGKQFGLWIYNYIVKNKSDIKRVRVKCDTLYNVIVIQKRIVYDEVFSLCYIGYIVFNIFH